MQKHTKNYLSHFDIGEQDPVICEYCKKGGRQGFDLHHIINRMKARPILDKVENIICLCRECHDKAHRYEIERNILFITHMGFLKNHGKPFNENLLNTLKNEKHR